MLKVYCLLIGGLLLAATTAWSGSYQFLSAQDVKQALEANRPMALVDIQVAEEFTQHHLQGAQASFAYPVKSATDRQKLDPLLPALQSSTEPVVIICPRGKGGAKRTYDYLLERGIQAERLYILAAGQKGWPYPELLVLARDRAQRLVE